MKVETVLIFEYTPSLEACPECGKDVYVEVTCDSVGRAFRFWACQFCEWHEHLEDWMPLSHEDWWDWMCSPALKIQSTWEMKTRRVVKE